MNKPQSEDKQYRLSNLVVNSIGLVRRGANRKPFFFVKSATGQPEQGEDMSDKEQDENVEVFSAEEIETLRALLAAKADEPATTPVDDTTQEDATPTETADFAEMLATQEKRLSEEFATKLEAEQAKTQQLAEAFAEEQHKRRLREFTDVAATYSLPISGTEQFGEDLMAIKDKVGDEVYERLTTMLRAMNEAVEQGDLFSQFARPEQDETGDPFLAKVEGIKNKLLESDPRKGDAEAFSDAVKIAQERFPDLAAKVAKGGV